MPESIEIREWPEDRSREWDEYLRDHPFSIAWHEYGWSSVIRKHYKFRLHPLAATSGGSIRGVLPLYYMRTLLKKPALISVPYAVAGGIVADDDEVEQALLQHAIGLAESYGSCPIVLKQYKHKVAGDLQTDAHYFNRELDLTAGHEAAWAGFSEDNRATVQRACGPAVTVDFPSKELDLFYRLLLAHHHRRGIPCAGKKWIRSLMEFGMYRIALLRDDGAVRAGTLVKEDFKEAVSFPYSCLADDQAPEYAYVLYWELIKRFADQGKKVFHSGRIPETEETDAYRLGWGGQKHPYWYQYYPPTTAATEFTVKRGGKRQMLAAAWKRMPRIMARAAGPLVVRQFP